MRKTFMAAAFLVPLSGCAGSLTALTVASNLLPVITTSLDAACASSAALATQAKAQPPLARSSILSSVNGAIGRFCGKVDPVSAAAGPALNNLNTVTADLLGLAGAAGIKLPGLAR
jgi:hypothetical protein